MGVHFWLEIEVGWNIHFFCVYEYNTTNGETKFEECNYGNGNSIMQYTRGMLRMKMLYHGLRAQFTMTSTFRSVGTIVARCPLFFSFSRPTVRFKILNNNGALFYCIIWEWFRIVCLSLGFLGFRTGTHSGNPFTITL
jgi:hypothetical protein